MKLTVEDIQYMVNESVKKILKELRKPIYRRLPNGDYDYDGDEWDDEEEEENPVDERQRRIENEEFDSYVVINDSDGSLIGSFSVDTVTDLDKQRQTSSDAEDLAIEAAAKDKYGSYSVFGTIDGKYDDDTLVLTYNHQEAVNYLNSENN